MSNSFLTLTLDDKHLPRAGDIVKVMRNADGSKFVIYASVDNSLLPYQVEKFLKRLRQAVGPFRYFLVGEYGDISNRPHYHAALFGIGPEHEASVLKAWGMGHVMLAELNIQTIRYITGYVTKKMTSKSDDRLNGRYPEFRLMSKGLGRGFVDSVVASLDCAAGEKILADDVPDALRLSGTVAPLGKYMRGKIRERAIYEKDAAAKLAGLLGSESVYNAKKRVDKAEKKMRDMYQDYVNSSMGKKMTFYEYLEQLQKQEARNIEATFKLKPKGSI